MEKEVKQQPVILNEHYEVEFVEDPGLVYEPGEYAEATEFIEAYCECNSPELDDVSEWLSSIPVPEAVAFIAEAWMITYKLHLIRTTDEVVN